MSYSRLVVKNLPNSATEAKLREMFAQKGTITDIQLKHFEDGRFRHFAFVGFKSPEEASTAKEYFDKAFFGATRMQVDYCYGLNDGDRPRPWSRHTNKKLKEEYEKQKESKAKAKDQEETPKPKKRKLEEEILEKAKDDPVFLEFLQVHNKNKARWGNDSVLDTLDKWTRELESSNVQEEQNKGEVEAEKLASVSDEEADEETGQEKKKVVHEDTFFYVKLKNVPRKAKKGDIKKFFAPLVPKSIRIPIKLRGFAYVGFLTEKELKKAISKHRSVLLGNQITVNRYVSRATVEKAIENKKSRWQSRSEELQQQAEAVDESGRIFVRNLAYTVTEDDLKAEFEKFGPITEIHLPVDRLTRQSKGFAFVSYMLPEHAAQACDTLNGTLLQGRMLHLLPSKGKEELIPDNAAGSSYKREKELKLKKTAGSSHNWNSLFLGQNAVAAVAADKYGVTREELLLNKTEDREDRISSIAVRMALAETEVVAETKKFLEANGVCLEAFNLDNSKTERSNTTILVKNLLANTTEQELREIFEKHGVVGRIVIPPSGVTAIVEFVVPAEARAAFKKLAYSKFKSMPLYLEWAPVGVFRIASDGSKVSVTAAKETDNKEEAAATGTKDKLPETELPNYEDDEPFDENMVPEPETTLFVKNLNFATTEDQLKKHFSSMGRVYAVTVAKKKDPKNPGELLSQGFGFVQFYRCKDAKKAMTALNQSMLQNHNLELKPSNRTLVSETDVVKKDSKTGTKLLVRNVPFQASKDEITDLFKVFGKLKAVRIPNKAVGESQHRGFAFVDFFTEANAKTAFDVLSKSTHLYGRRLVLEWAQKDESVEELRDKVSKQYDRQQRSDPAGQSSASTKKKLKRYFETEASKPRDEEEDDD